MAYRELKEGFQRAHPGVTVSPHIKNPERSVTSKAEVVMTVPEETCGGMRATAVALKTAKNPALAQAFTDLLTTPEAQEAVTKWGYGKLTGSAAAPQGEVAAATRGGSGIGTRG
jgi:ABC-type molybdate transport system substrate-binding protein